MPVIAKKRVKSNKQKRDSSLLRSSTLSQWGNSLGVRIPQEAVEQLGLKAGEQVQMEVGDGSITIRPTRRRRKWKIEELLKGVTPDKVGGELDWGPPVGKEFR